MPLDLAEYLTPAASLPANSATALLAGRAWRPDVDGPAIVAIRPDGVFDISADFATMRDLCEQSSPASALKASRGERMGDIAEILANTDPAKRDAKKPWLLAPCDLQAIKASGVTFAARCSSG